MVVNDSSRLGDKTKSARVMVWVWALNSFDAGTRTRYKSKELILLFYFVDKSLAVASFYSL
jgi:hypothetical protein